MENTILLGGIASDTLKGLTAENKYLLPRYFYDDNGSRIFQDIMNMPEYYLTASELEIFKTQKDDITKAIGWSNIPFELVELGSGDGVKTKVLLSHFLSCGLAFKYLPVDISAHANDLLLRDLNHLFPQLKIETNTGDYFDILEKLHLTEDSPKVILFLGANIGNFTPQECGDFLSKVARFSNPGDKLMVGFDLKKSPSVIMRAYSDPHGNTKRFNFNHLARLNTELGADFNPACFEQQTTYNPVSGAVRSFMVSKKKQTVNIAALQVKIHFEQWEPIFMELSQKYDLEEIEQLAHKSGFRLLKNFTDSQNYFVDSLWERIK